MQHAVLKSADASGEAALSVSHVAPVASSVAAQLLQQILCGLRCSFRFLLRHEDASLFGARFCLFLSFQLLLLHAHKDLKRHLLRLGRDPALLFDLFRFPRFLTHALQLGVSKRFHLSCDPCYK